MVRDSQQEFGSGRRCRRESLRQQPRYHSEQCSAPRAAITGIWDLRFCLFNLCQDHDELVQGSGRKRAHNINACRILFAGAAGLDIPMPRALVEDKFKFAQGPYEVKQMVVPGKPSGSETVT